MATVVHVDRFPHPGSPGEYRTTLTVCAPTGTVTPAGWPRVYRVTAEAAGATCEECLRALGQR